MLDTPANRASMPNADFSGWTPLADLASKILGWADNVETVENGAIYKIHTTNGRTDYIKI